MKDKSLTSFLLLLDPSPVQLGYELSLVPTESHHRCDEKWSLWCHLEKIEKTRKREEWLHDQNRSAKKSKIATKIRSRLEVLKRDEVKIVLVIK
jgi:hypothetical protein